MVPSAGTILMASTLAAGLSPVREVLANGVTVIVQESSATPAVSINATFEGGSLYDPEPLPGVAYLTSRVIDRGTRNKSADAIAEDLDKRGVALRVTTTRHSMTLLSTCLAEDFDDVLDLMSDLARDATFPKTNSPSDGSNPSRSCARTRTTHPFGQPRPSRNFCTDPRIHTAGQAKARSTRSSEATATRLFSSMPRTSGLPS